VDPTRGTTGTGALLLSYPDRMCRCEPRGRLTATTDADWAANRDHFDDGGFLPAAMAGRHPVVQDRSFSGLRTTQMCLILSPATSNANTVRVAPFC
jgi:hypothetical protein